MIVIDQVGDDDEDDVPAENLNQCTRRKGRSRCYKLRDEHIEHHDLITGEKWRDEP